MPLDPETYEREKLQERISSLESENAALKADVERLRKRTHEIADDGHRRVAEARAEMSTELIQARLDKKGREEVRAWLKEHGADPDARAADGRTMLHSISHHTTVAIHELLRMLSEALKEAERLRGLVDCEDGECDAPGGCRACSVKLAQQYKYEAERNKEAAERYARGEISTAKLAGLIGTYDPHGLRVAAQRRDEEIVAQALGANYVSALRSRLAQAEEALRLADEMAHEAEDLTNNRACSCYRTVPCPRCEVSYDETAEAVKKYRTALSSTPPPPSRESEK